MTNVFVFAEIMAASRLGRSAVRVVARNGSWVRLHTLSTSVANAGRGTKVQNVNSRLRLRMQTINTEKEYGRRKRAGSWAGGKLAGTKLQPRILT